MIFRKIVEPCKGMEDRKEMMVYLLAERMIRDAIRKGSQLINIRCHSKERFFPDKDEFLDMVEEGKNSQIKMRRRDYVLGVSIRINGEDSPYMSLPVSLFLPLLGIFSEKTMYKDKEGFAMYNEPSRETVEKFLDVTLYLESDSSISIEFEEIKS